MLTSDETDELFKLYLEDPDIGIDELVEVLNELDAETGDSNG